MRNEFMTPVECFKQIKKISLVIDSEKDIVSSVEEWVPNMCKSVQAALEKFEAYRQFFDIIKAHMDKDENYSEMGSGSTKAFKLCIPNCISVEEDENYIDDCYPNPDYDKLVELLDSEDL